jgi:hypothetical protein
MGFGLVTVFTALLKLINTTNYNTIANLHSLQFTMAGNKSFPSPLFSLVVAQQQLMMP